MSDTVPTNGLSCLNCGRRVGQQDIKLFAGVGVCPECHELAATIMRRGQAELRSLMQLMQEAIRTALVEGTLKLPRGSEAPSKAEVLGMIITMKEAHDRRRANRHAGNV